MDTTHKLRISYASGKLHQSIEYNTRTAFYPIGWTLQAVWERMMRDIGENIASDAVFFEYCKLFDQARRVLPAKVWNHFFAKSNNRKDSSTPLVMEGETPEPIRPCTTAGEAAEAASSSLEIPEVPGSTIAEGDTATLKSRQTRLLESPDAQNEVTPLKYPPENGFDVPLFNGSLLSPTTLTSERESMFPTNGPLFPNSRGHLYDDLYL